MKNGKQNWQYGLWELNGCIGYGIAKSQYSLFDRNPQIHILNNLMVIDRKKTRISYRLVESIEEAEKSYRAFNSNYDTRYLLTIVTGTHKSRVAQIDGYNIVCANYFVYRHYKRIYGAKIKLVKVV